MIGLRKHYGQQGAGGGGGGNYPLALAILNPGAESPAGGHASDALHWDDETGSIRCYRNASDGGTLSHSGTWYFHGSVYSISRARQDVAMPTEAESDIDAGLVNIDYDYYESGDSSDALRVRLQFYNGAMSSLGSYTPAYTSLGGGNNWVYISHSVAVPANTRTIRFYIDMDRNSGTLNDACCDDITAALVLA